MVSLGKVWMRMYLRQMPVRMAVPGARRYRNVMPVLVVFVMGVLMIMFHRFVGMFVLMTFAQVQAGAQRHQGSGD